MCGRLYLSPDDNGQLALEMLTSCAKNSWCSMLRQGATATMEAWTTDEKPNLSWSHPWASAPASAVVWGLFGIRATTPGWGSVVVKPQPGNLSWATIRVPSLRGPVEAAFNQTRCSFRLVLRVPDEVQATACLPRLGRPDAMVWDVVGERLIDGWRAGNFVCVKVSPVGSRSAELVRNATGDSC